MKDTAITKLSKKAQREYYAKQRNSWGALSPVTRCSEKINVYNRAKTKQALRYEY